MARTSIAEPGMTAEQGRLEEAREKGVSWRQWGPYLSERQWGTVREDYSEDGNAWDYFSHDQARSRAYHWGEDGLAGISDDKQRLCFALALWNGKDPILKERVFGLTNSEANHGEDVKEYYYYLDSTPTHSYMKYLYKYPQNEFPYLDLIKTNRGRGRLDPEYELIDTGIFNEDRYFDLFVEYAKASPTDVLIEIGICNRAADEAVIHVLPTLWFRNTWSWWPEQPKPALEDASRGAAAVIAATHATLGEYHLYCEGHPGLLFTENDTNNQRLFGTANATPYVKDGINDCVVADRQNAVNPNNTGTKAAAHYKLRVGARTTAVVRLRLSDAALSAEAPFGTEFAEIIAARRREADEFYQAITPAGVGEDAANVMRQALAGMLWSKQHFFFDLEKWLREHGIDPLRPPPRQQRNCEWFHMISDDVISMPDKWEYPWFAAWDLAFHTLALSTVDVDFAKQQLNLLLDQVYLHPTGQIPAYEWNFSEADASKLTDLQMLVDKAVSAFGRLDLMVNNAGVETRSPIIDTTEEQYDRVMAINLKSAFFGTQIAARHMIKQGSSGRIINISSVHEDWPMPGNTQYCLSKGGMRMLTRTAGVELAKHNILVVGVGPGAVATPINLATMKDPAKLAQLNAAIPLGRMAQPEEIASVVGFVAGDGASYLTATTIFTDGGIMQNSVGL
jgi:NAD(P)-dependent dehydrogenase (short-subunit alcohol dehydrogenase family)